MGFLSQALIFVTLLNVTVQFNPLFIGKFIQFDVDNYSTFLTALGIDEDSVARIESLARIFELKNQSDVWTLKSTPNAYHSSVEFKMNEPFKDVRIDGANISSIIEEKGNQLIYKHLGDKEITSKLTFTDDGCTEVLKYGNVSATIIYKKSIQLFEG